MVSKDIKIRQLKRKISDIKISIIRMLRSDRKPRYKTRGIMVKDRAEEMRLLEEELQNISTEVKK